jgi:TetR/AcrR family transcriptional regulator, cholesterol catabolism regulator
MARRNGVSAPPRERREEVYAAALRLFRDKGYHATSMQDIAAAVGLYKGSLYHYIGGKEELLVRLFEQAMGGLVADVERIVGDGSLRPSAQLRLIVAAHVGAVAENLDALTVYFHEFRALATDSLATVQAQRERYTQLVAQIVARGVRLGEFSTPDADIATLGLIGMCNWMCQWYRPGGRLGASEIARHFADMVLDGLSGKEPEATSSSPGPARRASRRTNG